MCGWLGRGCLGGSEWSERHGVGTCVSKWVGVARSSSEHLSAGRRRVALADKVGVGDTRWAPDRDVWLGVTTSAPAKWSHHPTTNHPLTWEQLSDGGPKESPQSRITPPPPPHLVQVAIFQIQTELGWRKIPWIHVPMEQLGCFSFNI